MSCWMENQMDSSILSEQETDIATHSLISKTSFYSAQRLVNISLFLFVL